MQKINRERGFNQLGFSRRTARACALAAATGAMAMAGSIFGQTAPATLYYDVNGTATGLGSGTGPTWDNVATDINWASVTTGTAPGPWVPGDIASFNAADTVSVGDAISLDGLSFLSGATTLNVLAGASKSELDIGSTKLGSTTATPFSINLAVTGSKELIDVPIVGSGDMIINATKAATAYGGAPLNFSGDLSQFTGNIYLNNDFTGAVTNVSAATLHINQPLSSATTIYLDEDAELYDSANSGATPYDYTIASNIVTNYNAANETGASGTSAYIGVGDGTDGSGVYGGATFTPGTEQIMTLSGVISGSTAPGVISNVILGGQSVRGTLVLSNQETYNGSTTVNFAGAAASGSGNGMLQMGVNNALPPGTTLNFGTPASTGQLGPMDLNGYSLTVASMETVTTVKTASGPGVNNGNIYNTSLTTGGGGAPATINITSPASATTAYTSIYEGDIGDTNLAVNPFDDNTPYVSADGTQQLVTTNTNISVVVSGTSASPNALVLAPVPNQSNGNEYSGTTTVNNYATLVFGRGGNGTAATGAPGAQLGSFNTITGNGTVTVNSGGTISSLATDSGHYVGGAAGTIILNSGSSFLPGEVNATTESISPNNTGSFSTGSIQFNSGAQMTFDLANNSNYDYVYLTNGLSLNLTGGQPLPAINIGVTSGGKVVAGLYTLISGSISGDTTDSNLISQNIALNTSGLTSTGDQFNLLDTGSALELQVLGPVLQWDPDNGGYGNVSEDGGTWNDSSTFANLYTKGEVTWSNTAYANYDVQIGNNGGEAGGEIDLGENIVVGGTLRFGPIYPGPGFEYTIENTGGNNYSLTLEDGMTVHTGATSGGGPSAIIGVPVVLGADQTWEIDSTEFLDVTGSLTGNYALTVTGSPDGTGGGTLDLESPGSIGALNVEAGIVLLGDPNAIGATTPITLNGGGVQFAVNGAPSNPITVGPNGGELGATSQAGGGPAYNVTFGGSITGSALTSIGSGNSTFTGTINVTTLANTATGNIVFSGNVTANSFSTSAGTVTLEGTNSFGAVNITTGTVIATSAAALTTAPILLNAAAGSTAGGTLNVTGFINLVNNINIGTNGSAVMTIEDDTNPLNIAGNLSGMGNIHLVGPEFTISGNNTNTNSTDFETEGMTVNTTSSTAFGTSSILADADATLNVEVDVTANAIRGSKSAAVTLTKTGVGNLTLTGMASVANYAGSTVVIDSGQVILQSAQTLIGSGAGSAPLNVTINSGAALVADWTGSTVSTNGAMTLQGGEILRPSIPASGTSVSSETPFSASSAADGLTITGSTTSTIEDAAVLNANVDEVLGFTNPVLVTTGSTLTLDCENTFGYANSEALVFRGPTDLPTTDATTNAYDSFTIQAGATVVQTGPGEVRFGRTTSQGIAIIGGTPGSSSNAVLLPGSDFYMTDGNTTANEMNTLLVVNGTGSTGLRIEAAMDATYVDPSTNPPASQSIGTTGLFGVDPYAGQTGHTNGNVFTILSPNRLQALSTPYAYTDANGNTDTITPSGTLTVAATDAGGATGLINGGPAAASNVSLALSNGTGSGGTLTYQINPGSTAGKNFANFAGLTVEQQSSVSNASVVAQIQSPTLIPALTIQGGAKLDITNQALAIDSASTGPATLVQVAGYLTTGFDKGNWDGAGIGSSYFSNGMAAKGTSIGYALNSMLATPFTSFGPVLDPVNNPGVQEYSVDGNAVIVAYTYLGDLNLDGKVDSSDFDLMGAIPASGPEEGVIGWFDGDLNYDNKINADDWSLYFLGNAAYDASGQAITATVPEPAAASLLLAGAGMLLRRRRRTIR